MFCYVAYIALHHVCLFDYPVSAHNSYLPYRGHTCCLTSTANTPTALARLTSTPLACSSLRTSTWSAAAATWTEVSPSYNITAFVRGQICLPRTPIEMVKLRIHSESATASILAGKLLPVPVTTRLTNSERTVVAANVIQNKTTYLYVTKKFEYILIIYSSISTCILLCANKHGWMDGWMDGYWWATLDLGDVYT